MAVKDLNDLLEKEPEKNPAKDLQEALEMFGEDAGNDFSELTQALNERTKLGEKALEQDKKNIKREEKRRKKEEDRRKKEEQKRQRREEKAPAMSPGGSRPESSGGFFGHEPFSDADWSALKNTFAATAMKNFGDTPIAAIAKTLTGKDEKDFSAAAEADLEEAQALRTGVSEEEAARRELQKELLAEEAKIRKEALKERLLEELTHKTAEEREEEAIKARVQKEWLAQEKKRRAKELTARYRQELGINTAEDNAEEPRAKRASNATSEKGSDVSPEALKRDFNAVYGENNDVYAQKAPEEEYVVLGEGPLLKPEEAPPLKDDWDKPAPAEAAPAPKEEKWSEYAKPEPKAPSEPPAEPAPVQKPVPDTTPVPAKKKDTETSNAPVSLPPALPGGEGMNALVSLATSANIWIALAKNFDDTLPIVTKGMGAISDMSKMLGPLVVGALGESAYGISSSVFALIDVIRGIFGKSRREKNAGAIDAEVSRLETLDAQKEAEKNRKKLQGYDEVIGVREEAYTNGEASIMRKAAKDEQTATMTANRGAAIEAEPAQVAASNPPPVIIQAPESKSSSEQDPARYMSPGTTPIFYPSPGISPWTVGGA